MFYSIRSLYTVNWFTMEVVPGENIFSLLFTFRDMSLIPVVNETKSTGLLPRRHAGWAPAGWRDTGGLPGPHNLIYPLVRGA